MVLFMAKKRERATGVPLTDCEKKRLWRKLLGDIGEQIIVQFLIASGWQIVCRKFRVGRSPEVDIIAISADGVTTFIEVKTRTIWSDSAFTWHESATQSIDWRKQKRVIAASRRYRIANCDYDISKCRYDIFLVGLSFKLASNLVDLKTNSSNSSLLVEAIDDRISEHLSGRAPAGLELIHLESAFVTNF
jgi:putative endonuclease